MKKLLIYLVVTAFVQLFAANSFARGSGGHGGGYTAGGHSHSEGHSYSHSQGSHGHSELSVSHGSFKTNYSSGYYKSGYAKVIRSEGAKKAFLRSQGYTKVPHGYEVDHIRPLSEGGADTPENMQLLSIEAHHQKTASERHKD